ncbi:MAG: SpoIIE family protein phosphatase [Candidatus Eremiobacteraeota bacterium]|nr:SpoIIE family protein phosphatase [Candidatus Eremiobacteraeota bacterium]
MKKTLTEDRITLLLIEDQAGIGEAVRLMVSGESDISFHYCRHEDEAVCLAGGIAPSVILLGTVMPEIDGLTPITYYRDNPATGDTPIIILSDQDNPEVKARAFTLGASDYLIKMPDRREFLARIRYHSRAYCNLLQRNEAYHALEASRKALADELAKAAEYVRALLPDFLDGPVKTCWKFIPSRQLGGDSFNYHWIDDEHFAIYLLDVKGHGIGATLLSLAVMNILRAQKLPGVNFRHPHAVLRELNEAFQMDQHNNLFLSLWYGVYNRSLRTLVCSSGGHPPALLITGAQEGALTVREASSEDLIIGFAPGEEYRSVSFSVGENERLYIYSDGAYEIKKASGSFWTIEEFIQALILARRSEVPVLDAMLAQARAIKGNDLFDDDFSLLEVQFC